MYGWVRAARETKGAITWEQYLRLSTRERFLLHSQIDRILEQIDQEYEAAQKNFEV